MRIWDHELAALDFETTGLSADGGDRAIEVAVVRGAHGETPRRWSTLIDPERPVGATAIHGITDAMLAGQPRFAAVADALAAQLAGAITVAHNARFDHRFLRAECARADLPAPEPFALDTLVLARRTVPIPSHSLASVCAHFKVDRTRAHRAEDDAAATWELAWRLLERLDPARRMTLADVQRVCRRPSSAELRVLTDALRAAARSAAPIEIEYRRSDAVATRRAITVRRVRRSRVEAWCHLREAERVFRLDRIAIVGA